MGAPRRERRQRDSRLTALNEAIAQYRLTDNQAIQRFAEGEVDLAQAKVLARQYYPVCIEFPIFLALCISRVYDEDARVLLVENLYEEHGELNLDMSHPNLFRKFVAAVDLDPTTIERPEKGSISETIIREYTENCARGSEHIALAYLYSFEEHFSGGMASIAKGCRASGLFDEDSLIFFDVHAVHDIKHAAQLQEALLRVTCTTKHWWEVCDAAERSAQLLHQLFDSILRPDQQIPS